jgi:hypothetical protein
MNKGYEEVSYQELARRVGDCVLNNEIHHSTGDNYEFELFNGEDCYCIKHESKKDCQSDSDNCEFESHEIYQEYIITESGAEYLQRNTNEIVFYCEALNMYLWGITHFGTSWSGVFTTIKALII